MDASTITVAALKTMDEVGFDKLTMRSVAARLGVQVGGLYYYLPDKTALLRHMADQICRQVTDALAPTGEWRADVLDLCGAVRRTLLARRDAARVFALSPLAASVGALGLMERLLDLLADGIPAGRVDVAGDTLLSYITGYVLQEQVGADVSGFDADLLAEAPARFPRVFTSGATDPNVTFNVAIETILSGFESGFESPAR